MAAGQVQGFSEHFYTSEDGLRLYARVYGAKDAPLTVVCLPGLTRNSRDFHQIATLLAEDPALPARVATLDYRGRGRSEWAEDKASYNLVTEARDVIAACAALGIAKAVFIGTSRGGLTLHVLAGLKPELIRAVVFNDIGPVLGIEGLKHIQAYLGEERPGLRDWAAAADQVRRTHGAAFPALGEEDWMDMTRAIHREADGEIVADFDPAIAAQIAALDLGQPVADLWEQFDQLAGVPMMVIRGEYSQLLTKETVDAMAARHPGLVTVTAEGQGHAPLPHLGRLPRDIRRFLDTLA